MSEHFVKHINIDRYKCFNDFSAEGFKRVNLISGKNNVGKTAFMEALAINLHSSSPQALIEGLGATYNFRNILHNDDNKTYRKKKSDYIKKLAGHVRSNTNILSMSFDTEDAGIVKNYKITIDAHSITIPDVEMDIDSILSNVPEPKKRICFINSIGDTQEEIIKSFVAVQEQDREAEVNKFVNNFDKSIESVKVIGGDSIQCKVIDSDGDITYRKVNEFGDGLRHYLTIIADLYTSGNCCLFIDELENGVHYSSLDQLWEIILTLSKELNVQVFATTHSKECIESYCRVAEKLKDEDISFTTLVKNKEKTVKAIVRDYQVFTDSIHDEREVRGW